MSTEPSQSSTFQSAQAGVMSPTYLLNTPRTPYSARSCLTSARAPKLETAPVHSQVFECFRYGWNLVFSMAKQILSFCFCQCLFADTEVDRDLVANLQAFCELKDRSLQISMFRSFPYRVQKEVREYLEGQTGDKLPGAEEVIDQIRTLEVSDDVFLIFSIYASEFEILELEQVVKLSKYTIDVPALVMALPEVYRDQFHNQEKIVQAEMVDYLKDEIGNRKEQIRVLRNILAEG